MRIHADPDPQPCLKPRFESTVVKASLFLGLKHRRGASSAVNVAQPATARELSKMAATLPVAAVEEPNTSTNKGTHPSTDAKLTPLPLEKAGAKRKSASAVAHHQAPVGPESNANKLLLAKKKSRETVPHIKRVPAVIGKTHPVKAQSLKEKVYKKAEYNKRAVSVHNPMDKRTGLVRDPTLEKVPKDKGRPVKQVSKKRRLSEESLSTKKKSADFGKQPAATRTSSTTAKKSRVDVRNDAAESKTTRNKRPEVLTKTQGSRRRRRKT